MWVHLPSCFSSWARLEWLLFSKTYCARKSVLRKMNFSYWKLYPNFILIFKFYDHIHSMIYYYKVLCCGLSVFTRTCYILYIFLCAFVCDCFPSTGQLIFLMDARGVPCEVAVKSRNVKCLVERVVLGPVFFTLISFHFSLLFYQYSKFIWVFMILISEGQAGDFWKPSKKALFVWT
jgi:hypothetical protein